MTRRVVEFCYRDVYGSDTSYFVSDRGFVTDPGDTPANTIVEGRVMNNIVIGWAVSCVIWGQASASTIGAVDVANADGAFDAIINLQARDCPVTIYEVPDDSATFDSSTVIGSAVIDQLEAVNDENMRVNSFERTLLLEVPIQQEVYNGSQANQKLNNFIRPMVIGNCENIRPPLIDELTSGGVYEVSSLDPNLIVAVKEAGAPIEPTEYTVQEKGFTLTASPLGQITASVATASSGGVTVIGPDELDGIGDFTPWSGGEPFGWDLDDSNGLVAESSGGDQLFFGFVGIGPEDAYAQTEDLIPLQIAEKYQVSIDVTDDTRSSGQGVWITFLDADSNVLYANQSVSLDPGSGDYTAQLEFVAPASRLKIRINSGSSGGGGSTGVTLDNITVREIKDDSEDGLPEICRDMIFFNGFDSTNFDTTEADILQARRDYAFNFYVDPQNDVPTIRNSLKQVLDSVSGWFFVKPNGQFAVGRIGPATGTPFIEIHEEEIQGVITRKLDAAAGLTTRIGVDRNWHPHQDGSILGSVDPQEQQRLTQEYLAYVEASDVEVLADEYEFAKTAPARGTLLRDFADGVPQAEIDEQVGLYGQARCFYTVPGVIDPAVFSLQPDSGPVRLYSKRLGLEYGTDLVPVGITTRRGQEKADLTLWGTLGRYRTNAAEFSSGVSTEVTPISITASKRAVLCFAFRSDDIAAETQIIFNCEGPSGLGRFVIQTLTDGRIQVFGENASGTAILSITVDASPLDLVDGVFYSGLVSVDMEDNAKVWVNGRVYQPNLLTFIDDTLNFGQQTCVGNRSANGATNYLRGSACHVGLWPGLTEDLTDPEVPLKYFDQYGRPVYGGANGESLNGTAPEIWFPEGRGENLGTLGGAVTQDNSSQSSSSPTDDSALSNFKRYQTPARGPFTTSAFYSRTGLSGFTDGRRGTACMAVRLASITSGFILHGASDRFIFQYLSSGTFRVFGRDSSSSTVLDLRTTGVTPAVDTWYTFLASWDLDDESLCRVYFNDVDSTLVQTLVAADIDYTLTGWGLGGRHSTGSGPFDGDVCHVGFHDEWLDLTKTSIRRRFFDKYNRPVFGGADGSQAFGEQPLLWFPGGDGTKGSGSSGILDEVGTVPLSETYPTDA